MQIFQLSIALLSIASTASAFTCSSGGSYGNCNVNGKNVPCTENSPCSPSYPGDTPPCRVNDYNHDYADCYI